jgi:hypothetical protein
MAARQQREAALSGGPLQRHVVYFKIFRSIFILFP